MNIVGYSDRLSVRPGETLRFMVSCAHPAYRADIVRLIHGDPNPEGPGFKEEVVPVAINGEYAGRVQAIRAGSYAIVPDAPALRSAFGLTLQAWIYPTTPRKGVQGIVTKWSESERAGYALVVDENGGLGLWLGDGEGEVEKISTGVPMHASRWYFVAAAFDAEEGRVTLHQLPVEGWPRDESRALTERATGLSRVGRTEAPLLMAAVRDLDASGATTVRAHFNGKIDSPRLFGRALGPGEIESLARDGDPALVEAPVAAWDFARDFASAQVTDISAKSSGRPAREHAGARHDRPRLERQRDRLPAPPGRVRRHPFPRR